MNANYNTHIPEEINIEEFPGSIVTAACDQETRALLTNILIIQDATQDSLCLRMTDPVSII